MALKLDDPDSKIDRGYDSGNGSYRPVQLDAAEKTAFDDIANNYDIPGTDAVEKAENTPNQSFVSTFTGNNNGSKKPYLKLAKKFGPTGGIVGIIAGLGMLGLSFTPATLLINLKENLVQKFDLQNTSMNIRTNKLIAKKIAGTTTSGVCGSKITIACKYERPSNKFLTKLESSGVKAFDKAGNPIDKKTLWPNERPATYEFTDSSGKKTSILAKDFSNTLATNDSLRSAFHKAYNPRFVGYADEIFKKVMARFGINKKSTVATETDPKKVNESINTETTNEPNTVSEAAKTGGAAADDAAKKIIEEEVVAESKALESKIGGKSDAIQIGAMATCFALDAPGMITKVVRSYQLLQLVKYGFMFLSVADAIKSGNATPQSVSAIGTLLTDVFKNNKGEVINGSAMDSFGTKYALFGDTKTTGFKKNFKNKSPGNSVASMSEIASVTSSPQVKTVCNTVNNPAAGVAITATEIALLGPETLGVGPALIKIGGVALSTFAASGVISLVIEHVVPLVTGILPMDKIASSIMEDITKDLSGEDVGNGTISAVSNMMSQTANAGANAPLSVAQAVAYQQKTAEVNLAYAKEDQATLSPFDASNPNTFLGSIATQMLPYFSSLSNVSSSLSSFGNIFSRSISMISGNTYATSTANTQEAFNMCSDKTITSSGVAAGPFCDIQYGVPVEYLDEDPSTVLANLGDQIDPETGVPVEESDLANWLAECTTGNSVGLGNCTINDQKTAEYALYTIDHRIQVSMDEETPVAASAPAATTGTGTPADVTPNGPGWVLKDSLDYSAIPCASGTTDSGLYTHPVRGFTIRKCGLGGGFVASIASQSAADMFAAAQTSGITLKVDSGFRSYEEQAKLYAQNCTNGTCRVPTAKPGNSQHESGLALDLNYGGANGFAWLKANASKYGYFNLPSEAWHWSKSGS